MSFAIKCWACITDCYLSPNICLIFHSNRNCILLITEQIFTNLFFPVEVAVCVGLFKAGQVHGICADGKPFTELLGCLMCLYSWEGEPCTLQAACLSTCLCMAHVMAPAPQRDTHRGTCPLACFSHHHPARSPYLFKF